MVANPLCHRSLVFFLVALLLAPTSVSLADARGRDRPILRTLPRQGIYANLSQELHIKKEVAETLVTSLEDKGFFLQHAIALLLLAKTRADRLIDNGKFAKEQGEQAVRASAEYLVDLIVKENVGWLTLTRKAEVNLDPRVLMKKANVVIGFSIRKAALPPHIPYKGIKALQLAAKQAGTKQPAAKQAGTKQPRKVVRRPDTVREPILRREVIYQNLAKELAVGQETVKTLLTGLESKLPFREGIMLMIIAKAVVDKETKDALRESVDAVRTHIERGTGWGSIGQVVGVNISAATLNRKVNALIGQK